MNLKKTLAALLALVMLIGAVPLAVFAEGETPDAASAEYELYPIPQQLTYGEGVSTLPESLSVYYGDGIDTYTQTRAQDALGKAGISLTAAASREEAGLTVEIYNPEGDTNPFFGTVDADILAKTDSYLLVVKDNKIGVLGCTTDAAFYGLTTLQQIMQQVQNRQVRNLTVYDWADVASRGFIEGYYGNPWSTEDRAELMRWGGNYKLNSYFYAPKDDPKHNAKWRELYTDEELASKIAPLAATGNESKCQFVFALHPFMSNPITTSNYEESVKILKAKFEQVMGAGVRQIAVLADDAGNQGNDLYVRLMTDLVEWVSSDEMQQKYPGLKTTIPFCPVQYGGNGESWMSRMPVEVPIVMTGGRVWGEVTDSFTNAFYGNVQRGPYMWINWPCTDNSKKHLIMGGYTTFLHPGVSPEKIQGIVLNPMQQSEPSKVAIFGNACYSWNIWTQEEADQAWTDSFKYVDHNSYEDTAASQALRELSKHMINQNMDGRVTALQESVVLAPELTAFKEKMNAGTLTTGDIASMLADFQKLQNAAEVYKAQGNTRIRDQIIYWLDTWTDITQAAEHLLEALQAYYIDQEPGAVPDHYTQAQAALERANTHAFWYLDHNEYAEVGVQHIMPFLRTVRDHVAILAQTSVDPTKLIVTPFWSFGNSFSNGTKLASMYDGDLKTETVSSRVIKSGDYVGLTFSRPIDVNEAAFLTGRSGNMADTFAACKLEYTTDGKTWEVVPGKDNLNLTGNPELILKGLGLTGIRGLRLTATANNAKWIGVREILINQLPPEEEAPEYLTGTIQKTSSYTVYAGPESKLTDGDDSTMVWYGPLHSGSDKDASIPGDYIGLDLGSVQKIGRVRVVVGDGGADKWKDFHVSYSEDGETWHDLSKITGKASGQDIVDVDLEGASARYVRLVNDTRKANWCKFGEFQVFPYVEDTTEVIHSPLWTIYQGSLNNLLDGSDSTFVWFDPDGSGNVNADDSMVGDYLGVDLGKTIQVDTVRFVIGNSGSDKWKKYHLEYTNAEAPDMTTSDGWTVVKSFTGNDSGTDVVEVNLGGVEARYIRMVNDEQVGAWVKFSEITVTPFDPETQTVPHLYTNSEAAGKGAYGQCTDEEATLSKAIAITLNPGEYVGIQLPRISQIGEINLDAQGAEALTLKAGATFDQAAAYTEGAVNARYVFLENTTEEAVTFTLNQLQLVIDEPAGIQLHSVTGLGNSQDGSDAQQSGQAWKWFDGDVNTNAIFARVQNAGGTIVFDLGQTRSIRKLEALIQDSQLNYIRKGVIEVAESLDGEWTTVINIDDFTANEWDNTTAGSVGWGEASSTYPNFRSYVGEMKVPVNARYLRVRITETYGHRWINLSEILINDGEYVPANTNPTFVADPAEVSGQYLPENMIDGNLSTGFKPNMEGRLSGSVIYKLSDVTNLEQINILQSSGAISNARVYVRGKASSMAPADLAQTINSGAWVQIGTLDTSLKSLYTYNFSAVYEIKLEWGNVEPIIYEIVLIPRDALAMDTSNLQKLCDKAEALDLEGVEYALKDKFTAALEAAKAVLEDPQSQEQVNQAYNNLYALYQMILNLDHVHNPQRHEAKAGTCSSYGNVEFWTCDSPLCAGIFYTDETCTQKLTRVELPLDPNNHEGDTYEVGGSAPTCTEPGAEPSIYCGSCHVLLKEGAVISATGHDYGKAEFDWSDDGKTCTVTFTCANDETHVEELDAVITSAVKTAPTCTEMGVTTYTATVTFEGEAHTDTLELTDIPAAGHAYGEPKFQWSEDGKTCTVTFTCGNDETHVEKLEAEVTSAVKTAPTCTEKGVTAYTATVTFQDGVYTNTLELADIPAAGHHFEDGVCTECGEKDPDYTEPTDPSEPTKPTDPSEPTQPSETTQPTEEPTTETTKPATDPEAPDQTGEGPQVIILVAVLVVSAACLVFVIWKLKKSKTK